MTEPLRFSIDGELLEAGQAFLPLPDDGLFRGDGVFEVARVYGGRTFALDLHLDRMELSAAAIDLHLDRPVLEAEADRLVSAGPDDCLIRLVVTRSGRRILTLEELPAHTPTITLASVTYSPTGILTGVKSLSYGANMHATRIARKSGAGEALLVRPDGIVLEPPTSSIFWTTREGQLRTPSLEAGVLDSITRRKIVERMDVEEGEYPLAALMEAEESFLASTTREAHPVSRVDSRDLPQVNGEQTKAASRAFAEALREDLDPGGS
ncbi:MAG: aminotransferase class IV [Solirubrobacterales bacterium]|nr:aminotransferase class IV [Solirubrobacterales bacterium]